MERHEHAIVEGGKFMPQIITVSREFGSGGRELGERLSVLLGFAYHDRKI